MTNIRTKIDDETNDRILELQSLMRERKRGIMSKSDIVAMALGKHNWIDTQIAVLRREIERERMAEENPPPPPNNNIFSELNK